MSETPACWSALRRDGAREYGVGFMSINSMSDEYRISHPDLRELDNVFEGCRLGRRGRERDRRRQGHGRETRRPDTQTPRRRARKLSATRHHAPVKRKTRSNFVDHERGAVWRRSP